MNSYHLAVSPAAVHQLKQLASSLQQSSRQIKAITCALEEDFVRNREGLGPHTQSIGQLLAEMKALAQQAQYENDRLALKANTAAMLRESLLDGSPYGAIGEADRDIARFRGELYEQYCRKMRQPQELDAGGNTRGHWDHSVFIPDPAYVPTNHNPNGLTFHQLQQQLAQDYGIRFTGIPYRNGYADFSAIAVAQVDWREVAQARIAKDPTLDTDAGPDHEKIFADRNATAACADQLAAQKGLAVPGLPQGYTAAQLAIWRKENGFTWEESMHHGYLLVPSVIHGNISHTGLVGIMTAQGKYTRHYTRKIQNAAAAPGKLRLSLDNIGKNIYRGKGLRLYRNGTH